jgi:ribosomal protein L3 glutamine methyltransferase
MMAGIISQASLLRQPTVTQPQSYEGLETIRDFVRWSASRFLGAELFFGHGTDNALDESVYLVLHALGLPPDFNEAYFASRLTPPEKRAVAALIERRISERKPAAYLTHEAWFAGLPFYVDERVLVPRSPIAELVRAGFEPWLEPGAIRRVLDLCTGSGCIGIACAHAIPQARVDLADVSAEALEVARENRRRHGLEDRVEILQSDLFESLDERRYDLIVSNPPYVASAEIEGLPAEFGHEPVLGLDAGARGLDLVLRILQSARDHLTENGVLIVEVGASAAALSEALPAAPFTWLDFEQGGEGVFLLTAAELDALELA